MLMRRLIWWTIASVTLALLVFGAIVFSPPRQADDTQIVATGFSRLDLLAHDFRVFGLNGTLRGEFWLGKQEVERIDLFYSPDGEWVWIRDILRQEGDSAWRMTLFRSTDLSAPIHTLTGVLMASWSHDGTQLVVTREDIHEGEWSIWIMNVECLLNGHSCTPQEEQLASGAWGPDWSPDDSRVAYTTKTDAVVIVDIETGQLSEPLGDDHRGCRQVIWSPSGQYLALDYADGLLIYDLMGGTLIDPHIGVVEDLDWLPDQDTLVFLNCYLEEGLCRRPLFWTEAYSTNAFYTLDMDTRQRVRITPGALESFEAFALWPALDQ